MGNAENEAIKMLCRQHISSIKVEKLLTGSLRRDSVWLPSPEHRAAQHLPIICHIFRWLFYLCFSLCSNPTLSPAHCRLFRGDGGADLRGKFFIALLRKSHCLYIILIYSTQQVRCLCLSKKDHRRISDSSKAAPRTSGYMMICKFS